MLLFAVYMDAFPIGWKAAYGILPEGLRQKAAYFYALRKEQQNKTAEALQVWERILEDVEEGSLTHRLVARELERIKRKD